LFRFLDITHKLKPLRFHLPCRRGLPKPRSSGMDLYSKFADQGKIVKFWYWNSGSARLAIWFFSGIYLDFMHTLPFKKIRGREASPDQTFDRVPKSLLMGNMGPTTLGLKKLPDDLSRIKLPQGVALRKFVGEIPTRPVMGPTFDQVKRNCRMARTIVP